MAEEEMAEEARCGRSALVVALVARMIARYSNEEQSRNLEKKALLGSFRTQDT